MPVADQHATDGRVKANLRTVAARRCGDGFRNLAHAAFDEAPKTALSGHSAHAVVHQDVGGAGGARASVGADHAIGCEGHFDFGRFEPLVEKIGGALREDFDEAGDLARAELAEAGEQL